MRLLFRAISLYTWLSYEKGCLNNEGTYQINVKIYVDQDSRHAITNFTHQNLPHHFTDRLEHSHREFEAAHLKHYIGTIFNGVNLVLKGTNVQFKADFADLFKPEYTKLHEKYCGYLSNILEMTENFQNSFENPHEEGENRLLIISCRNNNAFIPTSSHIATKNSCGKVIGVLLTDPEIMKFTIAEGLYKIFTSKSISQVQGINGAIQADICTYVQYCNRNFENTGFFVKDLGLLTHRTLTDADINGLGYKIGGRYIKNFNKDSSESSEFEEAHRERHRRRMYDHHEPEHYKH